MRNETRKHYTQMTAAEKAHLADKVKAAKIGISEVEIYSHCIKRIKKRSNEQVNRFFLLKSLAKSSAVEYKVISDDNGNMIEERVVLRSDVQIGSKQVVLVYSLTKKAIVTFWLNSVRDNHSTLDYSVYDRNLEIL